MSSAGGAPRGKISSEVMDGRWTLGARDENMRHVRHETILERWPPVDEPWAQAVEGARVGAIDRTPGTASFGR